MPLPLRPHGYASLLALVLAACAEPGDDTTTSASATTAVSDPGSTGAGPGDPTTGAPDTTGGVTTDATTGAGPTTADTSSTSASTGEPQTTGPATTGDSTSGDGTTGGGVDELPPTNSADLLEVWLAEGSYKSWAAESKVHSSAGPHGGNVRTYVNAALFQSLTDNNAMHPEGAAVVKELYGGGIDTPTGYAVMVKVAPDAGPNGEGWYWYERLGQTVYADGTAVGLCSGCHKPGKDNILTPFPLQ